MPDRSFPRFDPRTGRYHDAASGRFISAADVRAGVDRLVALSSQRMASLGAQFRAGELTAGEFQTGLLQEIKAATIASTLAAYGGREQMTPARWGMVGQVIRVQYAYARQFVADILDGRQRQNGRLDARARQYAQAARVSYENVVRQQMAERGMRYERNVLDADESCPGCLAEADQGWQPIGTLLAIGQRSPCRQNCRCTLRYAATMPQEQAA